MHQFLLRHRDAEQRVGLAGDLRHAGAESEHQIGALNARHQLRVHAEAEVARIRRVIGEKSIWRRNVQATGSAKASAKRAKPARLSDQRLPPSSTIGCSGALDQLVQLGHLLRDGAVSIGLKRGRIGDRRHVGQHILGQRDDHRAGTARAWRRGRRATRSRESAPGRRLPSPIWRSRRNPRDNPAPETPRARACRVRSGRRTGSSASNPAWRCAGRARRWWRPGRASRSRCPAGR